MREDLLIESLRINYIFSFFFRSQVGNYKKVLNWEDKDTSGKLLRDIFIEEINTPAMFSNVEFHQSEEREPLNNRSAIYFNFPHISITKSARSANISGVFEKDLMGKIRIHLALFETGMGVMWVSVQIDDDLSSDEINTISRRKVIPKIVFDGNDTNTPQSHYDIFHKEVNSLAKKMNKILDSHPIKFNSHSEKYRYIWDSKFWIDNENDYERGDNISQEPSIAVLIKSSNYKDYLDKLDFQILLSSILHGTNFDELDRSHACEHTADNYTNLYQNKKFLTQLHGNCLVVFHNEDYENTTNKIKEYNLFKEFTYGLFRTYCSVRGTWHIYNLLNEEIDEKLSELNRKIDNDFIGIQKAVEIKQNIIFKSHFLKLLSSEDPFVRGIGLTPFAKLHNEANSVYKTNEIKKNIIYKLNEYDKLISLLNSYDFYKFTSSDDIPVRKKILKYIFPVILTILWIIIYFINYFDIFSINRAFYIFLVLFSIVSLIFYVFLKKISKIKTIDNG